MRVRPYFTFSSPRTRLCLTPKHPLISLKNGFIVCASRAQETRYVLKGNLAHKLMIAKHYSIYDDFLLRDQAYSLLAYKLRYTSKTVLSTVKSGPPTGRDGTRSPGRRASLSGFRSHPGNDATGTWRER